MRPLSRALALALMVGPAVMAACRRGPDPGLIVASGHVEATDVRIATKVPGRLQSFAVKEGDRVEAGQTLAQVDATDLRFSHEQAAGERAQAEAELRLRVKGPRAEDIAEVEAQVATVEAEKAAAERDLARMQALVEKGSGTTKLADDARTRRDMVASRLAGLKQTLAKMRSGSRQEEIESARARVAALAAREALLEQQVKDATVTSPISGVVTEKVAEAGELLPASGPLCVVTDLQDTWLTVYVAEPDLARIRMGQEAEVVTDDGQAGKGRITFVSSRAEFTPKNVQTRDERVKLVYKVKLGLDNRGGMFKPGMPAEARIRAVADGGTQRTAR